MIQGLVPRLLLAGLLAFAVALPAAHANPPPPYKASEWGGWIDEDKNCRDTRQEVLIRDSLLPVLFRDGDDGHCEVAWGAWRDPYTGETFNDPTHLDIDHLVPKAWAHDQGGWRWSKAQKRRYVNDLRYRGHLRAVSASANRQKRDRGPSRWRPSRAEAWCEYGRDWSAVIALWGLHASPADRDAIRDLLRTCPVSEQAKDAGRARSRSLAP